MPKPFRCEAEVLWGHAVSEDRVVRSARVVAADGRDRTDTRAIAVEAPVELVYGDQPYAVMMATPADLEDFAVGFSLTEGVIEAADEVRAVRVEGEARGLRLAVDLAPGRLRSHLARRRAMSGRTGCGVCGIEDLAQLPRARTRTGAAPAVSAAAIRRALAALGDAQGLNRATRAVHAAAWADLAGALRHVREDVGRHNALDKLVGALARGGEAPEEGFLLVTSRCSFEMVEKAASYGIATLVAISAPTSLALERAEHHAMTLVAVARADSVTVFAGGERIVP
jgi:FdhD protein